MNVLDVLAILIYIVSSALIVVIIFNKIYSIVKNNKILHEYNRVKLALLKHRNQIKDIE